MDESSLQSSHLKIYIVLGTLVVVASLVAVAVWSVYSGPDLGDIASPPGDDRTTGEHSVRVLTDAEKTAIEVAATGTSKTITTTQKRKIENAAASNTKTLTEEEKRAIERGM